MIAVVGSSHDDILYFESIMMDKRKEMLFNRFEIVIGTIFNQEVLLMSNLYSSVLSAALINHILEDKDNPEKIWKSEIFGRSLDSIVGEGIQSKISLMPENIRFKLQQTLSKIVNRGSNNLIAIVL